MESNYINIKEIAEAKGLKSTRSLRLQINKPNSPYIAREVEACRLGFLPQQQNFVIK